MSSSTEDSELKKLNDKIQGVENEIGVYRKILPIEEFINHPLVIILNQQLTILLASKQAQAAQASSASTAKQGKWFYSLIPSIASTDTFL